MKRLLVLTGGGDCPGLNAVIRAIVKRASQEKDWEVLGSIQAFNGVLWTPQEIVKLTPEAVRGIHFRGGTIIETTNKGGPFSWPVKRNDGTWETVDRSDEMIQRLEYMGVDCVINIGGDGSQRISQKLFEKGLNIIGVPKTIDNDLSMTDCTFGFQTAVQIATEAVDKLVTTSASHNRVFVLEVMGRDAGWLTGTAVFGGAQVALVPEIEMTKERKDFFFEHVKEQFMRSKKRSLVIAVSEGVRWWSEEKQCLDMVYASPDLDEYGHPRFGGISGVIASEISKKLGIEARGQISGYIPRSGKCYEYDRRLTSTLADKVVDLLLREDYGKMPVMRDIVPYSELEEFHTDAIDMGNIGNFPLPSNYYNPNEFMFTEQYVDFLTNIIGAPYRMEFTHEFPIVIPQE